MSNYQHERGWLDSDVWGGAPYDERSAWSWMIGEAAFESCTRGINGIPMLMERGQLTASLRFMADKWNWKGTGGKDKVRRFLDKLERWSMISSATDRATGQTIITICNYNKYQGKRGASATDRATPTTTPPRQGRDTPATATRQTINPSSPSSQIDAVVVSARANDPPDVPRETERHRSQTVEVGDAIAQITGWADNPNWFGDYSRIGVWLERGWDVQLDILPTVRRLTTAKNGSPPMTLKYFEQAIADHHAQRTAPLPEGRPNATQTARKSTADRADDALNRALDILAEGRATG